MPKGLTIAGAREEELMEAASYYDNFSEDLYRIIQLIDDNADKDHANDKTRTGVVSDLLSALRCISCKDLASTDNFVHAALQKINKQEQEDLADDKPRIEARIKLAVLRQKAIYNRDHIVKLIEKCQKGKHESNS